MTTTTQESTLNGPALFIAQGWGKPGWTTLEECARSAAGLGYKGLQVPLWQGGPIDIEQAAKSRSYCEDLQAVASGAGCPIVELANHVEGQLVRCSPPYRPLFAGFAPENLRGNWNKVEHWAKNRLILSVQTTRNFGFDRYAAFPGTSIFHTVYPWPQRPAGLRPAAFHALARAWNPIFDVAEQEGVAVCFELHPMEDLMDAATFRYFQHFIGGREAAKILLDLSHRKLAGATQMNMEELIRRCASEIKMFHVKDAEFNPTPGSDAYGGYMDWPDRPGRFRSLGDGQIQYGRIIDLIGRELRLENMWATLEWEDCFKPWEQGVREGAQYISAWLNQTEVPEQTEPEGEPETFDDFAGAEVDNALLAKIIGIPVSQVNTEKP